MNWRTIITVIGLLCAHAAAQSSYAVPAPASSGCDNLDCIDDPAKNKSLRPEVHVYPPRSWEIDEGRYSPWKRSQRPNQRGAGDRGSAGGNDYYHKNQPRDTEFQNLVAHSTGDWLPIFGRDFFGRKPASFISRARVPIPADYTLGTGDQLLIHVWGQVELNANVIVDRNGEIYLPKVGMINVLAVPYSQLRDYLHTAVGRLFRNFDLSVSLGQLRLIQVYVVGRARRPGRYSMSALTTLVNALSFSGGPAANGSMRRIQLRRGGRTVTEFDLYDLLLRGDQSKDAVLVAGDVIYIPPSGPMVAVSGSVNQPAIYELRNPETVGEQITAAGGLTATADRDRALLERVGEEGSREVAEFRLDHDGEARTLRDGDLLRVMSISPRFQNAVTLRGNVAHPGRYPWREGMRVRDLLPSRQAVIPDEYWLQQNLLGQGPKRWIDAPAEKDTRESDTRRMDSGQNQPTPRSTDLPPDTNNSNTTAPSQDMASQRTPQDTGSGTEQPSPGYQASDHEPNRVERNPAEVNWDYAVVQRLNPQDLSSRLLPFNLGRALDDPASTENLELQPGDVVTVFSQQDIEVPLEKRTKFVRVEGEIGAAGVYRVEPGETLRDLVVRAGGLTSQAYLFAADFRRESAREQQEEKLQLMIEEMDKELRSKAARMASSANAEERQAWRSELEAERSVIDKLRQTRPTGRIVLELQPSDERAGALPPLPLEDGDRLTVPPRPATIEVVGAVYNQNSFLYRDGKSVSDYISRSGGATRDADSGRLFVIRADGSVVSKQMHRSFWTGSFESMRLMPGDTIVMPERIRTGSLVRGMRDWSQIFSQFALGAAAVRVISP